ncbi:MULTISPECIES: hypothetical protein [Providencia]|uniref:Uncharacterized protein n=1 Tax=Providencia huaxiensis TaxID=2027290 RepID=A0ABU2IX85_9GAMM|nr:MULTISPECIES: hypothetical protein [Providencia]MBZ3680630.1 hypothetical protein [Providencia rettgeri]AXH61413.1 hypothetical protein CYG50_04885 [Providencia huaxiensis]MDT0133682.1 hypothetical protein [Providencia huaxiensis]MDT1980088.1 hypothetical protein [Providencia huaxiensis]QLQ99522.1 hypothetical protein H0912_10150 [Providencia rettgeri]
MYLTQTNSEINAINGQMNLDASVSLTNTGTSTIHSGRLMNINANQLNNTGAIVSNNGKSVINTNSMNNRSGYIKGQNLAIKAYSIDNQAGLINAENNLDIETSYLNNSNSNDFKLVNTKFGLTDQNGGLQTNNGIIKVKGDTLHNINGSIVANVKNNSAVRNDVDINLKAALNNDYGKITAANNQKLDIGSLENYSGEVKAGKNLTIDSKNRINNQYGTLRSTNTTKVTSPIVTNGTTGNISGNRVIIDSALTN